MLLVNDDQPNVGLIDPSTIDYWNFITILLNIDLFVVAEFSRNHLSNLTIKFGIHVEQDGGIGAY